MPERVLDAGVPVQRVGQRDQRALVLGPQRRLGMFPAGVGELFRRWTMRILWELRAGPATFRALQERCEGLSPSVLNTRIAELREARLAEDGGEGYQLTAQGADLVEHWLPLVKWADNWAKSLKT